METGSLTTREEHEVDVKLLPTKDVAEILISELKEAVNRKSGIERVTVIFNMWPHLENWLLEETMGNPVSDRPVNQGLQEWESPEEFNEYISHAPRCM